MPHAFVTGASGFVGSEVAIQLCDAGWKVTASRRATSNTDALADYDVEWVETDIHDAPRVTADMPDALDCVFHVAGNSTFWPREFETQYRDNVIGTRSLVTAALETGAKRFIYTSSGAAYGQQDEPLREDLPSKALVSPVNYDRTKWLAENEVRAGVEKGLDAVILNPAAVLGPRDPNFTILFEQIAAGRLPAVMPARTSYCHIREVGRAHLLAYEKGRTGENYLLGGPNASQLELARVIAEVAGSKPPRYEIPGSVFYAVGAALELVAAITDRPPRLSRTFAKAFRHCWYTCSDKAIDELGYDPPSMREIAEDTLEWLRAEQKSPAT
ncbi:MAG: NAD-dependent epimerase/dehydratase family protein [Acidimicrobiia bacterium]